MERLPRTRGDIFRNAHREFAGLSVASFVEFSRYAASNIGENHPQRAAYGGIGFPALPKNVIAGVYLQALDHRTIDDNHRSDRIGGGLHGQQVELGAADRLY